jgi:predicted transcriptional regulator
MRHLAAPLRRPRRSPRSRSLQSPVRRSIQNDYLICLEDGQKFKSLKRHLMTHYGLTPEQYREKWDLAS